MDINSNSMSMEDDTDRGKTLESQQGYAQQNEPQEPGRRSLILLHIILNMALQVVMLSMDARHQAALVTTMNLMAVIHSNTSINNFMSALAVGTSTISFTWQRRSICRIPRSSPLVDQVILGSHNAREFKRRVRVSPSTFFYICSLLAPIMQKQQRGGAIPLETRVALALTRLGTGNYLLSCADLYGMSEALASIIVREFCDAVLQIIRPLVVPKKDSESLKRIAAGFEAKHDIPFIWGAIDGSHIPIIAPVGDPGHFYNRKGFYSVLLQGIVNVDIVFCDWDFGWAGSLHDYTMFVNSKQGRLVMAGHYAPYKLIADAAYPHRTCFWVPFKGTKETMAPERAHWNFIQSSTCMAVERAFGLLKGRWRILLKKLEMRLQFIPDVVGACICLHNLCVMHKDFVDNDMIEEAKVWLRQQHIGDFGDLKEAGTMRIFDYSKDEIHRVHLHVDEVIKKNLSTRDEGNVGALGQQGSFEVNALQAGIHMHRTMASILYKKHLKADVPLPTGLFESDESSDGEL